MFKDIIDKSPKYAVFLRNCIRRKNLLDCLAEIAEKEGLKGISQYIKKYGELIPKTKKEVRSITPDNAVKFSAN